MPALRRPAPQIPIMIFIDENCLIFDQEEENRLEYTDVHNVSGFAPAATRAAKGAVCI